MNELLDNYPDELYPWNFYFNGVLMPKWGATWWIPDELLRPGEQVEEELGHRDVYSIKCRLEHVGTVESEDLGVFVYGVQELLGLYLEHSAEVQAHLRQHPSNPVEEIYTGVVNTAFQMLKLTREKKVAFWTSGYEMDRLRLLDHMERSQLPEHDPRFLLAPHLSDKASHLQSKLKSQRKMLHQLAQSGKFGKEWRHELLQL
jgi:hypothetical protein